MLDVLSMIPFLWGCGRPPEPPVRPPPLAERKLEPRAVPLTKVPRMGPLSGAVALLKVGHGGYTGHELYVDGKARGTLPVDLVLEHGPHTFEILVGPGERLVLERDIEPGYGIRRLDLADPPAVEIR